MAAPQTMTPRLTTKHIVVHATMSNPPPSVHQVVWRARSYGYLDLGLHYVIDETGLTTNHRPVDIIGTGCRPYNATAVSILLLGSPPFSEVQMTVLRALCQCLQGRYPDAVVVGYRDLPGIKNNNDSPGFSVTDWWG